MMSITTPAGKEGEAMSFKDKKKFFEQEIAGQLSDQPKYKAERKFSYLQEHEVAKLRKEEETKLSRTSKEEMLSQMTETLNNDQDINRMMTSLGGEGSPRARKVHRTGSRHRADHAEGCHTSSQVEAQSPPMVEVEIQNGTHTGNGGL